MMPDCDRCGETADALYDDCDQCGPVWLCNECRKIHQGEVLIEQQRVTPEDDPL